ncbi:MAG: tetratricopeptide repeat protein [Pseudomonadota bacterium]
MKGLSAVLITVGLLTLPGALSAAIDECHALDDHGKSEAGTCYLNLLSAETDDGIRAEAYWRLNEVNRANAAFRRAIDAKPDDAELRARWGLLFLSAHQAADAEALFEEALSLDPNNLTALAGQAELLLDRFAGAAQSTISRALIVDPMHARTRVLRARLLLEAGNRDAAADILLDLVASSATPVRDRLDAMALLAAADHMSGIATPELPSPWVIQALEINPRFGEIHAVPAYFYVITRRYREAVALLEAAVALDPEHWDAQLALGTNLLRVNELEAGQEHLERAYSGDAFNAETVNMLRLLDTLDGYDTLISERLILRTHPEETAVLTRYVGELVDLAHEEMAPRYGFRLERPVVIELYQHHDDFAVRTAGLPGIGILGATFGDVVVMDGPSAKPATEWDWLSTVWHEVAHVVTLNATDNLVSRWFSEGVSVYEEQRFGPSPSSSVPFEFLKAMAEDRLLGVAELDNGFMRPQYEGQIGVSYVQAGLLCTFIADRYEDGLRRVLEVYATTTDTVVAIQEGLGLDPADLDDAFGRWLEENYGFAAANLADYQTSAQAAFAAIDAKDWGEARQQAERAISLYPTYTGPGNARLALARALELAAESTAPNPAAPMDRDGAFTPGEQGGGEAPAQQASTARQALLDYFLIGGRNPRALRDAVALFEAAGEGEHAHTIQRTLTRLEPMRFDHHARLGALATSLGHHEEALSERRLALALKPHDLAGAHYQVALALNTLGRKDEATRALLQALEIAPRYPEGLQLLREISR